MAVIVFLVELELFRQALKLKEFPLGLAGQSLALLLSMGFAHTLKEHKKVSY
ncbi:hypothetical protein NYG88_08055 [Campylobacter felis]|uniref:hypothetical protein n=1 Tax=Campylobacter felis TaxID=2974565 RepID=UPI002562AB50|nr:hypothetical protein [Campylobacter felis]